MPEAWTLIVNNWLPILIGVAGIVATVAVYSFTRRAKEPTWSVRTTDVVTKRTGGLTGLAVTFNGQTVSDLSVSRIVIFNGGNDPIRRTDIAPAAPLSLTVPTDASMLDASIVAVSNSANRLTVGFDREKNTALIDFDYLSKNEGAVVDVVHFGGTRATAAVTGVIIGASQLRYLNRQNARLLNAGLGLLSGLLLLVDLILVATLITQFNWFLAFVAGAVGVAGVAGYAVSFRAVIRGPRLAPKGLEAFDDRAYR